MHIVEVNEQLDYDRFYQGREDTVGAGRATWEIRHGLAHHYPCPPCKPVAILQASFDHDEVNVNLGKGVYDPELFHQGYHLAVESYKKWVKQGKPLHKDSPFMRPPTHRKRRHKVHA